MRRIGQAKAGLAADYAGQLARSVGKVVFFAKHIDVMDVAEETFAKRGVKYSSIRGDQTAKVRKANIDAFVNDPEVAIVVCSLTAAGVGLNLQVASNVVLAELSWTAAEQTQAIDRVHRIGQAEPVTAWRIIAAQTIDAKIAQLIDSKAGLAARALDGSDEEVAASADVQLEALVALLTEALGRRAQPRRRRGRRHPVRCPCRGRRSVGRPVGHRTQRTRRPAQPAVGRRIELHTGCCAEQDVHPGDIRPGLRHLLHDRDVGDAVAGQSSRNGGASPSGHRAWVTWPPVTDAVMATGPLGSTKSS